jgi:hypothetical protein
MVAGDVRGVRPRTDHDEVVPCDLTAIDAVACSNEFLLCFGIVDQHQIGVAMRRGRQCLPGALRQHPYLDAGFFGKDRNDAREQPGNASKIDCKVGLSAA